MNTPVSFELAELLQEKGINIWSEYRYTDFNGVERLEKEASDIFPYAPTIAEVVMWLYEKHKIWISLTHQHNQFFWRFGSYQTQDFNSPTEAYEAAIEYTLKNLI